MKKYLPDDKLAAKHQAFLDSEREEIGVKALDMAYKLKGSYAPEKTLNLNAHVDLTGNSKAQELAAKYEEELFALEDTQDEWN